MILGLIGGVLLTLAVIFGCLTFAKIIAGISKFFYKNGPKLLLWTSAALALVYFCGKIKGV